MTSKCYFKLRRYLLFATFIFACKAITKPKTESEILRLVGTRIVPTILVCTRIVVAILVRTGIDPTILERTGIVRTILVFAMYQNCVFQQFWYVPELLHCLNNSGT